MSYAKITKNSPYFHAKVACLSLSKNFMNLREPLLYHIYTDFGHAVMMSATKRPFMERTSRTFSANI